VFATFARPPSTCISYRRTPICPPPRGAGGDPGRAAVDLLFIDGDHSYEGCRLDFEMYRDLVAPDGLIVFHDICMFPDEWQGAAVASPGRDQVPLRREEIIDRKVYRTGS